MLIVTVPEVFCTIISLYLVIGISTKLKLFHTNTFCASVLHFIFSFFLRSRKFFPAVSKNEAGESEVANINSSFCWKVFVHSKDAFEWEFEVLARFIGLPEDTGLNIPSNKLSKISVQLFEEIPYKV